MSSTIGRMPAIAAPMPAPVKPDSESGVSRIRSGPNSASRPLLDGVAAAIAADVLAHQEDARIPLQRIADRLAHSIAVGELDGLAFGFRCRHGATKRPCPRK